MRIEKQGGHFIEQDWRFLKSDFFCSSFYLSRSLALPCTYIFSSDFSRISPSPSSASSKRASDGASRAPFPISFMRMFMCSRAVAVGLQCACLPARSARQAAWHHCRRVAVSFAAHPSVLLRSQFGGCSGTFFAHSPKPSASGECLLPTHCPSALPPCLPVCHEQLSPLPYASGHSGPG